MTFSHAVTGVALAALIVGCHQATPVQSVVAPSGSKTEKLRQLSGEAALEPAYVRVTLVDRTRSAAPGTYKTQALPASWASAQIRLHATSAVATLTQDRVATIERATDFGGGTSTSSAVFSTLRPGNYIFQVTLFTGSGGNGTSAAVHTVNLNLAGGTATSVTVTMKTTDGTGANGGTTLNATVDDTTSSYIYSGGTNYNSILGGPGSIPVLVAGDTLAVNPDLADSTATGGSSATAGTTTSDVAALATGVLSRVVLSYARQPLATTGPNLEASEVFLTDWVRSGNEPIRGTSWATLADSGDGATWPSRTAAGAPRTGSGTFAGVFSWATSPTTTFTNPVPFIDESALSANYKLVFRYYDNTYSHNLIRVQTKDLAVVSPASIGLTVQ